MSAEGEAAFEAIKVPDVVRKTLTDAESTLESDGLTYDTPDKGKNGNDSIVLRQDPASGTSVAAGTLVHLYIAPSR